MKPIIKKSHPKMAFLFINGTGLDFEGVVEVKNNCFAKMTPIFSGLYVKFFVLVSAKSKY